MTGRLVGTVVVASTLLWGCVGSPAVRDPDLDVDVPDRFLGAPERAPEVPASWWEEFGDPRLTSVVREALEHNYDLSAAAARVEQAVAQARIAGADLEPQITAGLNANRAKRNFIGFPIPGEEVLSVTSTSLGVSLDVGWEVDLWGRLRASARAAVADLQSAQAVYSAAWLSLAAQTAKAWIAVAEANQQVALAERTVASWQRSYDQIERRYKTGVRTPLELRLAGANLDGARALFELRNEQLDRAARQLEALLGRYPARELEEPAMLPDSPSEIPAGVPAELLQRRPDLAAAERRLAAADQRLLAATRALYPRLTLTGSAGTSAIELADLADLDFGIWSLAAGLVQPVFQGGRLRAAVRFEDARAREAMESYWSAVLEAYREVETALAAERFIAARVEHLAEASRQSTAAQALAESRYDAGIGLYITVLESQRRALDAEASLIEARRRRLENRIDLYLALGGGFRRPDDDDVTSRATMGPEAGLDAEENAR